MENQDILLELSQLDSELQNDPQNTELLLERAKLKRRLSFVSHNLDPAYQALENVNMVLKLKPDSAIAWLERGMTYYILNRQDEAIADYNRSLAIAEDSRAFYNRGVARWHRAASRFGHNFANNPLAIKEAEQVLQDYEMAIKLDPSHDMAYYNRGVVYIRLGNFQQAIIEINKSLDINPKDHLSHFNKAICLEHLHLPRYSDKGNVRKAIDEYSHVIELAPDYIPAYYNRAVAYEWLDERGRYKNKKYLSMAIKDYDEILRRNSTDPGALVNRGWAFEHLGELTKAVKDYQLFLQLSTEGFIAEQMRVHLETLQSRLN